MRLTLVNQFYKPDLAPTGHLAAWLADHRAEHGDQVTVVTSSGGYVPESSERLTAEQGNPHIYRLWSPQLGKGSSVKRIIDYSVFFVQACLRMLLLPAQDVILSLTTPPFIHLSALLHKTLHRRARVMVWIMDCYPEVLEQTGAIRQGGWISASMRALNRFAFRRTDRIICLDMAMSRLIQSQYAEGGDFPQIEVIPNWERSEDFPEASAPSRWETADQLSLEGKFVILYLGNAGYGHRFETVIEAARQLRNDPYIFLFVGGGEKWAWLEQAKEDHDLANIVMHPYVPKEITPSVMAAADCGLITLNDEALGVISPSKLHGYLAMGLPVIYMGPAGGNVDEAIRQHALGASLRHGDVAELVSFVKRLSEDPAAHAFHAQNARKAFLGSFSGAQSLEAFDHLLDSPVAPSAESD
jgi:glycosyltransferase involved in cell wall biosynthesis